MICDPTIVAAKARLAVLGEPATIYPDTGDARAVTVVVDRDPPEYREQPRGTSSVFHVEVLNDATLGVAGSEWTPTFQIALPRLRGGSAVRMRLVRAVRQTDGMLVFEVR